MKINEIFSQNWEKISYFYLKIDYKLTQILAQIDLKLSSNSDQKWGGTTFWIMDLGWGVFSTYKIWKYWEVIDHVNLHGPNSPRSCPIIDHVPRSNLR